MRGFGEEKTVETMEAVETLEAGFGLRELAVAGAFTSAAVLAFLGHAAFAGGAAALGVAALLAQAPEIVQEKEKPAIVMARRIGVAPRFMP